MNRVRSNFHAVKKNMATSLSQLELLQSVAYIDGNSPTNNGSHPHLLWKKLFVKKHGDVKIVSELKTITDANFDECCHTGKYDVYNSIHYFQ